MVTKTEGRHAEEFLLSEASGQRSREKVTISSGTPALEAGEVLGIITATGEYTVYDNGASDGTETAAAILARAVDASAADAEGAVIRRDAEVTLAALTFQAGQNQAAQDAAVVDLTALGIIAR